MGINARDYRKSAGNSGRDRRAPTVFDPRSGACGRFPLIPSTRACHLAGMIQGQVLPVRTAHARQSMANEGANPWCLICKSSLESTLKESAMRPKCRIFGKLGMKLPITPLVSMGRRNTQLRLTFIENKKLKPLARVGAARPLPWLVLGHISQTDRFFTLSICGSGDSILLHRPVELARPMGKFTPGFRLLK